MSNQVLGWLRTIVPGGILLGGLLPLWLPLLQAIGISAGAVLEWLAPVVLALPLGWLYETLNVRYMVTDAAHDRINGYIASRLARFAGVADLTHPPAAFRVLKPAFYRIVDNDNSLSILAERIRKNGIVWTSAADAAILLPALALLYATVWLIEGGVVWLIGALALVLAALLIGFALYPVIVANHLALCSDQLDHMEAQFPSEVQAAVHGLAASRPDLISPSNE